jgi:ribose 5-phosphate isomerase B
MADAIKKIAVGADHAGFLLKQDLVEFLKSKNYEVLDAGTHSQESTDYPGYALKVAEAVAKGGADRGLLLCHSGIGMDIVANKVRGIRAGLCLNPKFAELSRQHNDTNVLCLASGFTSPAEAKDIVTAWLQTSFEGGRHERRVNQIKDLER